MTEHRKTFVSELALGCCKGPLTRDKDLISTAARLDSIGYWSVEAANSSLFEDCVGQRLADPWERIRRLRKAMPNTKLALSMQGQSLLGQRLYADDVLDAFVTSAAECGIEVFRIFDALGDLRNLFRAIGAVKAAGRHAQGSIVYTVSPFHSNERFIEQAVELAKMGCDSICLLDHAGLLNPIDGFNLIAGLKANVRVPIALHCGTQAGMAEATLIKAVEAGCDIVDAAIPSLAPHAALPSTEAVVSMLSRTPFDTGISLEILAEAASHIPWTGSEPRNSTRHADPRALAQKIPGDMIAEIEDQLREQGAIERLGEVLREIPLVRKELGQAPLTPPISEIVGTQSVLNVLQGGRYKTITAETRALIAGRYGQTPAPIEDGIKAMALAGEEPISVRPADLIEPEFERLKRELGAKTKSTEDALTYALFPALAPDFFKAREGGLLSGALPTATADRAGSYSIVVDGISFDVVVKGEKARAAGAGFVHATHLATEGIAEDHGITVVSAPFAGKVLRIDKRDGASAAAGETVMAIESMNMETSVKAPGAGRIYRHFVAEGARFQQGQPLYAIKR